MKKFISVILVLVFIISCVPIFANAEEIISDPIEGPDAEKLPISVRIWYEPTDTLRYGDTATFYSEIENEEYYTIILYQWQLSADCEEWDDIENANEPTYAVVLDDTTVNMYYRLYIEYNGE